MDECVELFIALQRIWAIDVPNMVYFNPRFERSVVIEAPVCAKEWAAPARGFSSCSSCSL